MSGDGSRPVEEEAIMIKGEWRKSSFSNGTGGSNCVEVAQFVDLDGLVSVRHSKYPNGIRVTFTPDEWRAFIAGVKAGEFGLEE